MSINLDPITSAPGAMAPMPQDARPETLREVYARANAIILRDGILDAEEQAAITEHLLVLKTSQEGRLAGGPGMQPQDPAAMQAQENVAQNGAMQPRGASQTEPYGSVPGSSMRGPY